MRKILFSVMLALYFIFTDKVHAQRALPGMRGLELRGGMVDGIYSSKPDNETGYSFGAAMSTYTKNANKWVFGAEYLNRYYPYKDTVLPWKKLT